MKDKSSLIILNGTLQGISNAGVPVTSRGLMYGDGCFETFCSYSGQFLHFNEHVQRLRNGLQFLGIDYPADLERGRIGKLLKKLLKSNELMNAQAIIRIQVWRKGERGYATASGQSGYVITVTEKGKHKTSFTLATVRVTRIPSAALPATYKFTNGLNYITAANQAKKMGTDDALMQTVGSWVSETTVANVFWLKDDIVYTPSEECDILPGTTRKAVLSCLAELNILVEHGTFPVEEVKQADTVWICNSIKEIMPVRRLDTTSFDDDNPIFKEIRAAFNAYKNRQLSTIF